MAQANNITASAPRAPGAFCYPLRFGTQADRLAAVDVWDALSFATESALDHDDMRALGLSDSRVGFGF